MSSPAYQDGTDQVNMDGTGRLGTSKVVMILWGEWRKRGQSLGVPIGEVGPTWLSSTSGQ